MFTDVFIIYKHITVVQCCKGVKHYCPSEQSRTYQRILGFKNFPFSFSCARLLGIGTGAFCIVCALCQLVSETLSVCNLCNFVALWLDTGHPLAVCSGESRDGILGRRYPTIPSFQEILKHNITMPLWVNFCIADRDLLLLWIFKGIKS